MEVAADALDGGQQFVEDGEELERHAAGQSASSEGRAVHSRLDGRGGLVVGEDEAEGQAAGDRLGGYDDVRQSHGVDRW